MLAIWASQQSRVYNPQAALFAQGEQGVWYDLSDFSTLFQDTAGTLPVTAVGQRIARINDKSGNENHATRLTTAQQPILRQTGSGKYYAEFDGIDDSWETANIDFSATDEMTVIAGATQIGAIINGTVMESSASAGTNNGTFFLFANRDAVARWGFRSRGTAFSDATTPSSDFPASTPYVITGQGKISTDTSIIRVDGTEITSSITDQGTGNYAAAQPLYVGRRGATTLPFSGYLFGLIVRGKSTSGEALTDVETFMASRSGVTI